MMIRFFSGSVAIAMNLFHDLHPVAAQTYAFQCIEPAAPIVPDSGQLMIEYKNEIEADFQRYFSEVTEYTACLSAAQSTAFTEAKAGWQAYQAFRDQAADPRPGISPEPMPDP